MPRSPSTRIRWLAVVCAALVVVGLVWDAHRTPHATVISEPPTRPWKTIGYEGIQVDIPAAWVRVDRADCEFRFDQWGPPGPRTCGSGGGVAFYSSATFDPAYGPGVRRTQRTGEPTWGGWVDVGDHDHDVYVADDDRDVVSVVLHSAR